MSQQINLFNPIFLKQKKHFSALTMAQGLGMIFLGSLAVTVFARFELGSLASDAENTTRQLKSTQAQLAKVAAEYAPRQRSKQLEEEVQRAEEMLKAQRQVFDLMQRGGFGHAGGYSEYFRAFARQIVNGIWLTGFRISGSAVDIELRGRALHPELVPIYINRLKQEPALRGKSFAALEMVVPDIGEGSKDAAGNTESRRPADYIEFVLQSAAVEQASGTEAAPRSIPPSVPGNDAAKEGGGAGK